MNPSQRIIVLGILLVGSACSGDGGSFSAPSAADDYVSRTSSYGSGTTASDQENASSATESQGCSEGANTTLSKLISKYFLPICQGQRCNLDHLDNQPPSQDSSGTKVLASLMPNVCQDLWNSYHDRWLGTPNGEMLCGDSRQLLNFLHERPECNVTIPISRGTCMESVSRCARDVFEIGCTANADFDTMEIPASCRGLLDTHELSHPDEPDHKDPPSSGGD